jgi:prepilin-type N-terminal cleavage/methylation domain-containing protein
MSLLILKSLLGNSHSVARLPDLPRKGVAKQALNGFSLIELLVSVAIGLLLISLGIAGYVNFNERQKVINSARELETVFQAAQVKAQSGDLGGCTQLDEYKVEFTTTVDPIVVTLTPVCGDATLGTAKTYQLSTGTTLTFSPAISTIHFPVLRQGVSFTPPATQVDFNFTSSAVTQTYTFTLAQGGDISDGTWN